MSAVNSMYLRNQLGLDAASKSICGFIRYCDVHERTVLGTHLDETFGPRTFTTLANVLNALGFVIHANSKSLQGVVFCTLSVVHRYQCEQCICNESTCW